MKKINLGFTSKQELQAKVDGDLLEAATAPWWTDHYYLDENRNVIQCQSEEEATSSMFQRKINCPINGGHCPIHVGDDQIGESRVSTVFLGIDHSLGVGPPIVFETMVFRGPLDDEQERYATWEQAERGHQKWIEKVKTYQEGISPKLKYLLDQKKERE